MICRRRSKLTFRGEGGRTTVLSIVRGCLGPLLAEYVSDMQDFLFLCRWKELHGDNSVCSCCDSTCDTKHLICTFYFYF